MSTGKLLRLLCVDIMQVEYTLMHICIDVHLDKLFIKEYSWGDWSDLSL